MAKPLQSFKRASIKSKEGVNLFGIRHLSPAGSYHLLKCLDEIKPELVLIEGPSDANFVIDEITRKELKLPIAILCYNANPPVNSLIYPFAIYSPEYQALLWAKINKKEARFIDLPSNVKSYLTSLKQNAQKDSFYADYSALLYEKIANSFDEDDYESYWERVFEQSLLKDSYINLIYEQTSMTRELCEDLEKKDDPVSFSINALREQFMKMQIMEAIKSGVNPEKILVIVGAYHLQALLHNDPMSKDEFKSLQKVDTKITLMPYSYYKLSSFSGYGAGNKAPNYFEYMFKCMQKDDLDSLSATYISHISKLIRKKHGYSSSASAIEALRLANSLAYIKGSKYPTLKDMQDAVVATIANGEKSFVIDSFAQFEVGTKLGYLPDGVSQTPIQDDLNRQLKELKLVKYKSVVKNEIELDLRENFKVKSKSSAFLDLKRSIFFHRLKFLNISFALPLQRVQDRASYAEKWALCYDPQVEIETVEATLLGDTIYSACSYVFKNRVESAKSVDELANLIKIACECSLLENIFEAIKKLQDFSSESFSFLELSSAASELFYLIKYGSIRKFDCSMLEPILKELILKCSLLIFESASCTDEVAKKIALAIALINQILSENFEFLDDDIWFSELKKVVASEDKNPFLSGSILSTLLQKDKIKEDELLIKISKYLSLANSAQVSASWFEGLSFQNRYILLSNLTLWQELDKYINALDEDEFKKVLVCLRRALSSFDANEKNRLCDLLSEIWNEQDFVEILQNELSEQEESLIQDLDEFDFSDLM